VKAPAIRLSNNRQRAKRIIFREKVGEILSIIMIPANVHLDSLPAGRHKVISAYFFAGIAREKAKMKE
jgi:hypothetical protein